MTRLAPFPDADLSVMLSALGRSDSPYARRLYLEIHAELERRQTEQPTMRDEWLAKMRRAG